MFSSIVVIFKTGSTSVCRSSYGRSSGTSRNHFYGCMIDCHVATFFFFYVVLFVLRSRLFISKGALIHHASAWWCALPRVASAGLLRRAWHCIAASADCVKKCPLKFFVRHVGCSRNGCFCNCSTDNQFVCTVFAAPLIYLCFSFNFCWFLNCSGVKFFVSMHWLLSRVVFLRGASYMISSLCQGCIRTA